MASSRYRRSMALQIFRVLVRGRFGPLDASARARLLDELPHHTVASAAFTETGTLTYDRTLDAFGFRQQVRVRTDDGDADDAGHAEARARALGERSAAAALAARSATARDLRTSATDMASIWERGNGGGGRPRRVARGGGPPRDP